MFSKLLIFFIFFTSIYAYFNVTILGFIGFYALLCWCVENFESPIRIAFELVRKYLLPIKYESLKEKFGDWAGTLSVC